MELIAVSQTIIGQGAVNAVNAKELHSKLGVKTKFVDWMKRAIEKYGFEDGVDFISFLGKSEGVRHDVEGNNITTFMVLRKILITQN